MGVMTDPYGIDPSVKAGKLALKVMTDYLSAAPDGVGLSASAHAAALAAGLTSKLASEGLGIYGALGRAAWVWDDSIGVHVPCCNDCGAGLYRPELVTEGLCVDCS
jgi:hypothetical protein